MSRSQTDESQRQGVPSRTIEEAYYEAVEARRQYIDYADDGDERLEHALHHQLHKAVIKYFEVLHHQLETKQKVREYWETKPLYQTGWQTNTALFCSQKEACGFTIWADHEQADRLHPGATCPRCGEGFLDDDEAYVTDEAGEPEPEYARGLLHLEDWYYRPTTDQSTRHGYLGVRTVTERSQQLLPVSVLFRAARYLDEAADELELLVEVNDDVPEAELTIDTMERFQERLGELVNAAEEEDGDGDE